MNVDRRGFISRVVAFVTGLFAVGKTADAISGTKNSLVFDGEDELIHLSDWNPSRSDFSLTMWFRADGNYGNYGNYRDGAMQFYEDDKGYFHPLSLEELQPDPDKRPELRLLD